jgi:hypothetical protein
MSLKNKDISLIFNELAIGDTTLEDLKFIVDFYEQKYKTNGKTASDLIELESFKELNRRLASSVFGVPGAKYKADFRKHCISAEYKNTKLFIDSLNKIFELGKKYGDVTNPTLYGQSDPGYKIPLETLVHLLVRHNSSINEFINPDSKHEGYSPSSFSLGAFADPMLTLLMALNVIENRDWKLASKGKNLICHFRVGGQEYTITRKGNSKEIKSFYPRNDDHSTIFLELERNPEKMEFIRK